MTLTSSAHFPRPLPWLIFALDPSTSGFHLHQSFSKNICNHGGQGLAGIVLCTPYGCTWKKCFVPHYPAMLMIWHPRCRHGVWKKLWEMPHTFPTYSPEVPHISHTNPTFSKKAQIVVFHYYQYYNHSPDIANPKNLRVQHVSEKIIDLGSKGTQACWKQIIHLQWFELCVSPWRAMTTPIVSIPFAVHICAGKYNFILN